MRIFYTFLFLSFYAYSSFGQGVIELPLQSNPVLVSKFQKDLAANAEILKKVNTPTSTVKASSRGPKAFVDTLYIVSGDSLLIETDTSGFFLDTLFLANNSFNYGEAKPVYKFNRPAKTNTFQFKSQQGIILGKDTLGIVLNFTNKNKPADTLYYWVIVKRKNNNSILPLIYLKAEKDTILCASKLGLTGLLVSSTIADCLGEDISFIKRKAYSFLDTCVYYKASRLGGTDSTTCLTLCDENQVCDNFLFPIKVLQDTLSTKESELFMDDFSYEGPYPDSKKWLDDRAFINSTMATNPPSVGMATFDGLNYTGSPYGNGFGISDVLTSAYLNLTKNNIPLYLSFYVQPKGLGFSPDIADRFIIEFKTPTDQWVEVKSISTDRFYAVSEAAPDFKQYSIAISDSYLYKGFQFRFRAFGSRTGINDVWNLDYVRISKENPQNTNGDPNGFNDLAFTRKPGSFLKNYTAAPWKHIKGFETQEVKTFLPIDIYSHFSTDQNITDSRAEIKEKTGGTNLFNNYSYFTASFLNIQPMKHINQKIDINPSPKKDLFDNLLLIPANAENLEFNTILSFDLPKEQNKDYGTSITQNDQVSNTTICSNYFAYDDGTAESVITTQGTESQLQVKFRANVDDSLRAVSIHFPHFNKDITNMRFNLRVFIGSLSGTPAYEKLFLRPDYPDRYENKLQGFTQYLLTDLAANPKALYIPKGDFYVGWQQVTTGVEPFVVGFDKNNPEAMVNNFKNTTGSWQPLTGSKGALMLRPKLSSMASQVLSNSDRDLLTASIFPNPATEYLYVNIPSDEMVDIQYEIFDMSGRLIQSGITSQTIDIANIRNGVYIVRLLSLDNRLQSHHKISIIK
ncbi:MAG: T9SS type A sorting domain-containing protein [Saprospiraceae bacterium]